MNKDPLTKLTYGVYIISSKNKNKTNACIINTCVQVASDPVRVAISITNTHYTRKLIKESGVFCISVLDETCPFELIKQLGYQSGKDVDKLKDIPTFYDINGIPCILRNCCATLSVKVTDYINLDSHTIFIGIVRDSKILSDTKPLTYAHYQSCIMPKANVNSSHTNMMTNKVESEKNADSSKDMVSETYNSTSSSDSSNGEIVCWRCQICGYEYKDPEIPDDFMCPSCGHPREDFAPIYK